MVGCPRELAQGQHCEELMGLGVAPSGSAAPSEGLPSALDVVRAA